jgi:hypothetical protein
MKSYNYSFRIVNILLIPGILAIGLSSWGAESTDKIQRENLDGSNLEDLVTTGLIEPAGIALSYIPDDFNMPEFKLTASDGASGDQFGNSVSISGIRCVIGAHYNDDAGNDSGSAYIFEWDGTNWIEQTKLTASDGAGGDHFGRSVSISGDRCVVGADGEGSSGSVYIFEWNDTNWIEQIKLIPSDEPDDAHFGFSVSMNGDRCIVGASYDDSNGINSGSAYIFEWDGMNWSQQVKLTASDGYRYDYFGYPVSISGDRCIIGASYDDDKGLDSGSAYIFEWDGMSWIEWTKLTDPNGAKDKFFGDSVSISGDRCIVGAKFDDANGDHSGSAYIFEWNGVNWNQQTKLTASDAASYDYFGDSVNISGNRCIIGATHDDDMGMESGSAYIFEWDGINWNQRIKLTASDGADADFFGNSVSISGDCCVVGAYYDDDNGSLSGSAYVYGPPCIVDFHHFARFAQYWLETGTGLPADLYEDSFVDLLDLELFVDEWLDYCPADWPLK